MVLNIKPGFTPNEHTASLYIKHRDDAERFVNPVTLTDSSGSYVGTSTAPLEVTGAFTATIVASDIQIGAVELKNATTDDRVTVSPDGWLFISSSNTLPSSNADYTYDDYASSDFESGSKVKTSAGVLYGFTGYNSSSAYQFIQIHDSATWPAMASVPKIIIRVSASDNFSWDSGRFGISFSLGIAIANSNTGNKLTTGSADTWFNVRYK